MKKILAIALSLVLVMALCATASAAGLVGVAMPTQDLQRWNQDGANMKAQLEAAGFEVDLQYANNDVGMQVSQIENMILNEVQVLVVASIDGSALGTVLAQAKEAGIKYPWLTQKTAMFYRLNIDKFDFFTADASTNFFAVDRATGEVVNVLATADYVDFCKLMGKWGEMGLIHEDDWTKVTTDTTTQSKDWAVSWWTDIPVNAEANARYGQEVVMTPATNRYAHSTSALGSCYAVTTTDEAKIKAAIDFMGLLYTDSKLADMYTFGIEGEDFTYTQEEGQTIKHVTQNSEKYNHSMWESAHATVVTPLNNEPDNKADLYDAFNGGALTSCAAGFRFDKSPVEAQFAACQGLFEQYGFALENGAVPADQVEDYIAQYQADLDAAGYQECLAEFQAQYEAWKAQ